MDLDETFELLFLRVFGAVKFWQYQDADALIAKLPDINPIQASLVKQKLAIVTTGGGKNSIPFCSLKLDDLGAMALIERRSVLKNLDIKKLVDWYYMRSEAELLTRIPDQIFTYIEAFHTHAIPMSLINREDTVFAKECDLYDYNKKLKKCRLTDRGRLYIEEALRSHSDIIFTWLYTNFANVDMTLRNHGNAYVLDFLDFVPHGERGLLLTKLESHVATYVATAIKSSKKEDNLERQTN